MTIHPAQGGPDAFIPDLEAAFPSVELRLGREHGSLPTLVLDSTEWDDPALDLLALDERLLALGEGDFAMELRVAEGGEVKRLALEVLTRCQHRIVRENATSRGPAFARLLARHRGLHALERPLVRADYLHALDVRHWALRLEPDAGLAVQVAALFHDVERLHSEPERRVEHLAPDYGAFKAHHALGGSLMVRRLLGELVPGATLERVAALIRDHEQPGADPELALLNDADGLSFFSLNSAGYLAYFGRDQTRRKVAYTLGRLRPAARRQLFALRHPPEVRRLLAEASSPPWAPAGQEDR